MNKNSCRSNGKKGGRPKGSSYNANFIIEDFNTIVLTEEQYNSLIKRYGYELTEKALYIFDDWLKNSPFGYKYKGKNIYAHFRSDGWVINQARLSIQQT